MHEFPLGNEKLDSAAMTAKEKEEGDVKSSEPKNTD